MKEEKDLIEGCLKGNGASFEALYRRFAPKMMVVCNRYARDADEAKDLLQDGFIRVFDQLKNFRGEGSFEGWIRRIMVTTSLENYRRNARERENTHYADYDSDYGQPVASDDVLSQVSFDELLQMVQELTPSYRMVFNLYVFEGMKHHEIATQMGISEGTSKSNLADARRILQKKIVKVMYDV